MDKQKRHIHFVGIGGVGMSGIAEVLINIGHTVSGSDIKESDLTKRLTGLGAKIYFKHQEENIKGAVVLVISSAVPESNPEIIAAKRDFIPVIPRAEMLAELMRLKHSIAVGGSHGKTTTTSLMGTMLTKAGLDPTLVIGGRLKSLGAGACLGQGEYMVAEADESDGSFLLLSPTIAVVTNIDLEHLNFYKDIEALKESFLTFINRIPFYGAAILCLDDQHVQSLLPKVKKRYLTYGFSAQAEVSARNLRREEAGQSFELLHNNKSLGRIKVNLFGQHNALNALAACAVGLELSLSPKVIAKGLAAMDGIERRFEYKGQVSEVVILDDYAHHPTEIKATLKALAEAYPEQRRVVVFQPHRYSRTEMLFNDFLISFNQADQLWVTEIHGAGETAKDGIYNGEKLAQAIVEYGHRDVIYEADFKKIPTLLAKTLQPGDIVITLGAGSVWQVGEELLKVLEKDLEK